MTVGFLFCLGAVTLGGFIAGWVGAELGSGRYAARARFDREQRRLRAVQARQRADADLRAERWDGAA